MGCQVAGSGRKSKHHLHFHEGGSREWAAQPHLDPWNVMEQIILEVISKHTKDNMNGGKISLINLIAFYSENTGSVNEARAVDVTYLYPSKAFSTASHHSLTDKLRRC